MGPGDGDYDNSPLPANLVVPDDASSLEADRLAWLAEQRALRRRRRLRRLVLTRRWERFGMSGPIVVGFLLLTALVGALTVLFVPRPTRPEPVPAPLTSAAEARLTAGGGVLGRRLPTVALDGDVRPVTATDLRPAVIVLTPPDCRCADVLRTVYRQARVFRLSIWLIGTRRPGEPDDTASRARLVGLDEAGTGGGGRWAVDPAGGLARAVGARGPTLVAVRADGAIIGVERDLPLDPARLPAQEALLGGLSSSGR